MTRAHLVSPSRRGKVKSRTAADERYNSIKGRRSLSSIDIRKGLLTAKSSSLQPSRPLHSQWIARNDTFPMHYCYYRSSVTTSSTSLPFHPSELRLAGISSFFLCFPSWHYSFTAGPQSVPYSESPRNNPSNMAFDA